MGDNTVIFEKIEGLILHYICKENSKEEISEFQKQFEVLFDYFREELVDEIGTEKYELLDDIYLAFDQYEPNEIIREEENYCIDEFTLIRKIKKIYEKLKELA